MIDFIKTFISKNYHSVIIGTVACTVLLLVLRCVTSTDLNEIVEYCVVTLISSAIIYFVLPFAIKIVPDKSFVDKIMVFFGILMLTYLIFNLINVFLTGDFRNVAVIIPIIILTFVKILRQN